MTDSIWTGPREARREGTSKRAKFFRYKDRTWTFTKDDVARLTRAIEESKFAELNAAMKELGSLIAKDYSENDPIWDKGHEVVDKIANIYNSLLNPTEND